MCLFCTFYVCCFCVCYFCVYYFLVYYLESVTSSILLLKTKVTNIIVTCNTLNYLDLFGLKRVSLNANTWNEFD